MGQAFARLAALVWKYQGLSKRFFMFHSTESERDIDSRPGGAFPRMSRATFQKAPQTEHVSPESPRAVVEVGLMSRGRSGGTEPLGSLVAEEQNYGAGNQ